MARDLRGRGHASERAQLLDLVPQCPARHHEIAGVVQHRIRLLRPLARHLLLLLVARRSEHTGPNARQRRDAPPPPRIEPEDVARLPRVAPPAPPAPAGPPGPPPHLPYPGGTPPQPP